MNNSRHSGGLALFVNNKYSNAKIRNDLTKKCQHIESLFVEIFDPGSDKLVVCGEIYHRPNTSIVDFSRDLETLLNVVNDERKTLYLLGDFNKNLLNSQNNNTVSDFIDLMHSKNLYCLINRPTRVTSTSYSLIDNIWTNNYTNCIKSGIIYESISDHFPIFSLFMNKSNNNYINYNDSNKETITYRNFNQDNILKFKQALSEVQWDLITHINNLNVAYDNFLLIFSSIFDRFFPLLKRRLLQIINLNHG